MTTTNLQPDAVRRLAAALPAGHERDELLKVVRVGLAFCSRPGRRPGFLRKYLAGLVQSMPERSFEAVLVELENCAARRDLKGAAGNPIESVNRVWEKVTYHDPKKGRSQVTFKTVKNILSMQKQG